MDYNNNNNRSSKRVKTHNFNSFTPSIFGAYQEHNNANKPPYLHNNNNNNNNNHELSQPAPHVSGHTSERNLQKPTKSQVLKRLFITYPKEASEAELCRAFAKFGQIMDISVIKDHDTQIGKGIVFIEFVKASEALLAMEEMNGKYLENHRAKALKVLISQDKTKSFKTNKPFASKLLVKIDKNVQKFELRNIFGKYGEIQSVWITHDRITKESKGFGFVTFVKSSDAARALEDCNQCFEAKFAFQNINGQCDQPPHLNNISPISPMDICQRIKFPPPTTPGQLTFNFDHLTNCNQFKEKENIDDNFNNVQVNSNNYNSSNLGLGGDRGSNHRLIVPEDLVVPEVGKDSRTVVCLKTDTDPDIEYPFNSVNNKTVKSDYVLRINCKLNQSFIRSIFDLIPGMKMFQPNGDEEFLAKYVNDLVTFYAMKKLNQFELPNNEALQVEYIKENEINSELTINKNTEQIFVSITCEKDLTNELLQLIMNQFKNLTSCKILNDNKTGFALFSNKTDATLAVNTLNDRVIARNHFHAHIETDQFRISDICPL